MSIENGTLTAPVGSTIAGLRLDSVSFVGDAVVVVSPDANRFISGISLTDSSIEGSLTSTEGSRLTLAGEINNLGSINVESDNEGAEVSTVGDTVVQGGGEIVLSNDAQFSFSQLNNVDNTIRGDGALTDAFETINGGTIRAEGGTLEILLNFSFGGLDNSSGRIEVASDAHLALTCLLYTSPSPRDQRGSRMPSSA